MENDILITLISALIAAISFAAFAIPFLRNSEKRERYQAIIEKRRKDLYAASRESGFKIVKDDDGSAVRDSLAGFYKVQDLAGEMGEKVRDKMLQAGNRNPSAPLKFMIAQGVLPLLFCGFAMFIMSASDKEISNLVVLGILFFAAFSGFKLPDLLVKNTIMKRQEEINLSFPDALDMMLICVQGGIGLEQTIDRVAEEIAGFCATRREWCG